MVEATQRVLDFARESFRSLVDDLLDDPSFVIQDCEFASTEDTYSTPQEAFQEFRQLACDLGIDFDALVSELGRGSDIRRLQAFEKTGKISY